MFRRVLSRIFRPLAGRLFQFNNNPNTPAAIDRLTKELRNFKQEFIGFSGGIAKSNDEEVTLAVEKHLAESGKEIIGRSLNYKIKHVNPDDKSQRFWAETDGFILVPGRVVIVEAKSQVRALDFDQVERTRKMFQAQFDTPVKAYVGGPVFAKELRKTALDRGFGVVTLSGGRYSVEDGIEEQHIKQDHA
ncbi:hypothetical protein MP228_010886 [Amoeboaphelidium protococcarum]|nr:hypothetical protein MP228_010886 [Amoeboaphelidium protococcarum]